MLLSLEGEEKSGKTTLAYTAPLKIVGFQFDLGSERALKGAMYDTHFKGLRINTVAFDSKAVPVLDDMDITIFECPQPIQVDDVQVQGMVDLWNYFLVRLGLALRDPLVRTVVIDTMTIARRVKADAYLEALQKKGARERLQEIEYAAPNGAIRDIYTALPAIRKNLVATHHLTDERVEQIDGKGNIIKGKTGKRVLEGLNGTHRFVDVALRTEEVKGQVVGTFVECGYNLGLKGVKIQNPTWDSIVQMVEDSRGGRLGIDRRQEIA